MMTPKQEAAIRARDAEVAERPGGYRASSYRMAGRANEDRRVLLAEIDRLRGLLAEPSDAMIEAARISLTNRVWGWHGLLPDIARAALVAGLRAMVKP